MPRFISTFSSLPASLLAGYVIGEGNGSRCVFGPVNGPEMFGFASRDGLDWCTNGQFNRSVNQSDCVIAGRSLCCEVVTAGTGGFNAMGRESLAPCACGCPLESMRSTDPSAA